MIHCQNISHVYKMDAQEVPVLQGVSFRVEAGEQVAVMGRSGSGKSTLMNILGLMLQPSEGMLTFADQSINNLCENQRARMRNVMLGMVFQSPHLIPNLSAEENVALPALYKGAAKRDAISMARQVLVEVGLEERFAHTPARLSGGQRQRVAIARAIINTPKLLIADEPTGALDEETGEEILALFQRLGQQYDMSLIVVTHDRAVARQFPRQLLLVDGRLQVCDNGKTARRWAV